MDHGNVTVDVTASNTESVLEQAATIEEQFTEASPATVSVELTNTGDSEYTSTGGPTIPLEPQRTEGEESSDVLYLVPEDGYGVVVISEDYETLEPDARFVPTEPEDGCWKAASANMGIVGPGEIITLDPGDSHVQEYVLLAHPDNDGCLERDTYVFTDVAQMELDTELTVVHS